MARGYKTGGRKKGTPNARNADISRRLDELGCDPISGLAQIAMQAQKDGDLHLSVKAYAHVADFYAPKRRAIEHTIDDNPEETREEMLAQMQQLQQQIAEGVLERLPAELREKVQQHLETPEGSRAH